jgi:hypothetical protein
MAKVIYIAIFLFLAFSSIECYKKRPDYTILLKVEEWQQKNNFLEYRIKDKLSAEDYKEQRYHLDAEMEMYISLTGYSRIELEKFAKNSLNAVYGGQKPLAEEAKEAHLVSRPVENLSVLQKAVGKN